MCIRSIQIYTCAHHAERPEYNPGLLNVPGTCASYPCCEPVEALGRLPNGQKYNGAPHLDPERPNVRPCKEARAQQLAWQDVQAGRCQRGVWCSITSSAIDPQRRLCAEHIAETRAIEDEARHEREELESQVAERYGRSAATRGAQSSSSTNGTAHTKEKQEIRKPSSVPPSSIASSGSAKLTDDFGRLNVNEKAGNPMKDCTASAAPTIVLSSAGSKYAGVVKTKKGTTPSGKASKPGSTASKSAPYYS